MSNQPIQPIARANICHALIQRYAQSTVSRPLSTPNTHIGFSTWKRILIKRTKYDRREMTRQAYHMLAESDTGPSVASGCPRPLPRRPIGSEAPPPAPSPPLRRCSSLQSSEVTYRSRQKPMRGCANFSHQTTTANAGRTLSANEPPPGRIRFANLADAMAPVQLSPGPLATGAPVSCGCILLGSFDGTVA